MSLVETSSTSYTHSSPLTITMFGPMQVRLDGESLPHLRSRKALWLLALLVLKQSRPVERDWLAATLWPDAEVAQSLASLRAVLSDLRRAMGTQGERLHSPSRHTLQLDLTDAWVDVLRFQSAVRKGDYTALQEAVALYQGSLLEGCAEECFTTFQTAYQNDCLSALQRLAMTAHTTGDDGTAILWWRKALTITPRWEMAQRGLMEGLARSGDSNGALQAYRDFVRLLRREDPQAVPDDETVALYKHLRDAVQLRAEKRPTSTTSSVVPAVGGQAAIDTEPHIIGHLPHSIAELVGREDEREEVQALLVHHRLVTLTGAGGIGKTRLALAVANDVVSQFPDGVWLVALEGLSESGLVVPQIAGVLGVREKSGQPLLESLQQHLQAKRLLLVLDNCEHVLEVCAETGEALLQAGAGIRLLATSRERLGILGEKVWTVPGLAVPDLEGLPAGGMAVQRILSGYDGIQLFIKRAQAIQKDFQLTKENARDVAQVCVHLEGLPLALELAAARMRVMTPAQIAVRLDNQLNLLTGGSRTAPARQKTLRATLDWSYALLSVAEQGLLARLSVFAGGATLPAVEMVCSGAGVEKGQVLDLLASLVEKSMVLFENTQIDGRYHLLETVQQYATERLTHIKGENACQEKHLAYFLTLAEEAEPYLHGPEQEDALRRLDREYANLRMALVRNTMGLGKAEEGMRLAEALWEFWRVQGRLREGSQYLEVLLAREDAQGAPLARVRALNVAGDLAIRQGKVASARTFAAESLALSQELGDQRGIANSLYLLAQATRVQGDHGAAVTLYQESVALYRQMGDWRGLATSLHSLAAIAYNHGDYVTTRELLEQGLAIYREKDDSRGIALVLDTLGHLASAEGDPMTARALLEEALGMRRELGEKAGIAYTLYGLGEVAHTQHNLEEARILLQESVRLYRESEDSFLIHLLGALGHVEREAGEYIRATILYQESLRLRWDIQDVVAIACSLEDFANLARYQGQHARAVRLFGAVAAFRATLIQPPSAADVERYEHAVSTLRSVLSEEVFAALWEEGQAMTREQAVIYALTPGED